MRRGNASKDLPAAAKQAAVRRLRFFMKAVAPEKADSATKRVFIIEPPTKVGLYAFGPEHQRQISAGP